MNVATQKFMTYSQWAYDPASVIAKPPMPTYEELSMAEFPAFQPERHIAFHVVMGILGVFTFGATWVLQAIFGLVQYHDNKKKATAHQHWVQQSQDFARQLATQYENARTIGG
jgi:hypothetical protein